jgi:hypothetical protein
MELAKVSMVAEYQYPLAAVSGHIGLLRYRLIDKVVNIESSTLNNDSANVMYIYIDMLAVKRNDITGITSGYQRLAERPVTGSGDRGAARPTG